MNDIDLKYFYNGESVRIEGLKGDLEGYNVWCVDRKNGVIFKAGNQHGFGTSRIAKNIVVEYLVEMGEISCEKELSFKLLINLASNCQAIKKSGVKCVTKAIKGNRYCRLHQKFALNGACIATLNNGKKCRNVAKKGQKYCGVHQKSVANE